MEELSRADEANVVGANDSWLFSWSFDWCGMHCCSLLWTQEMYFEMLC
jgi:hypothetical protein